jgi:divalent metal cation (Fe/Co/Zn/Cd) transporter
MIDRLTRITTALAVIAVASVAAIISYQHAYELVRTHGESGLTARLLPFTVDGLIWAASMLSDGTSVYHGWRCGALAPASSPPLAPTWRMA